MTNSVLKAIGGLGLSALLAVPVFAVGGEHPVNPIHSAGGGQHQAGAPAPLQKDVFQVPSLPFLPKPVEGLAAKPAPEVPPLSGPEAARAELKRVQEGLDGVPANLSQVGDGAAKETGVNLEDAMTGSRSAAPVGELSGTLEEQVQAAAATVNAIRAQVGKVIIGQKELVDGVIMVMIAGQHGLLEGLPGVGKTETAKSFADAIQGQFQRVQGTPDLLPPDILGTQILQDDPATGRKAIELVKGPVFTNILLVDEINRMAYKTQSSLLQAMAEKQVTIGRQTFNLPGFTVLATQNPIEQTGTNPLPEAQLDRFMFKMLVAQPNAAELKEIVRRNKHKDQRPRAGRAASLEDLDRLRRVSEKISVAPELENYIYKIAMAAKETPSLHVSYAVYTRAAIFMEQGARLRAMINGRTAVLPQDVKAVAPLVLRHRIVLDSSSPDGVDSDAVIRKILETVPVPESK